MSNNSRRLAILSAKEVDDIYGSPHFTEDERYLYFDLSTAECEVVAAVRTVSVAVHLTLQIGYFKAKQQFFSYQQDAVIEDLNYILKQNFPGQRLASIKLPSKPTRIEQHQTILQLFNYRLCDSDAKVELESKARRVAMLSIQPVYILRELTQHLAGQRIVVPSYRCLQEMIGRVVTGERTRITKLLTTALTPTIETQLKTLLEAEEGVYGINLLKHEPKDFSYKELRREVDRYEFLIYRLLRNALASGDVFVRDSNEFRCFEDDLIGDERWRHKNELLEEIGAPILIAPIQETLTAFERELEAKFKIVNQRITDGVNQHIKVSVTADKSRWKLIYPSAEEPVNSPFYSQLPGIGIADLLWFVAANTGFLNAFTHVLDRYVKQEPDLSEILACIVAMGTNMGLGKMAEVSGLSHTSMMTTARNYLRLETLHAANDAITNAIATLPVFHLYNIQDVIHSSSDGQRMETQIDTINARYSPKYFGLQKGVSAYTLVANHVPINAKIIGTHEHESHYVFDLLHNNTSDIKPERHSTDTHGTNQVNFWILHAFGYHFAPRYRDLHKKMGALVGARHPNEYSDFLIKPVRKIYRELIEQEWPNIQRIMASLAQKDVTQATIVRKLASYERQNQTKKALWELENICRTLYILDFIDDVTLRQTVQKVLNRGEAYHRFRRAIAYVNGGKFRVKTEGEQQIWNECSRLISNAVIYYNTLLLSRVYEQKQADNDQKALAIIKDISPVAWQHINLFGKFEFSPSTSKVDIDALVVRYADPTYWHQAIQDESESNLG